MNYGKIENAHVMQQEQPDLYNLKLEWRTLRDDILVMEAHLKQYPMDYYGMEVTLKSFLKQKKEIEEKIDELVG